MAKLRLTEASLFSENNQILISDTNFFLRKYLCWIKWNKFGGDFVLDIGCTTGDALIQLLLPAIKWTTKKIIAVDMSQEMIDFAKQKWQHPKVSFEEFDFRDSHIPPRYEEAFDHVFSFYSLHNVQNQIQAFDNIRRMLKDDGDCFITMLVKNPFFDIIDIMMKRYPKWVDYLRDGRNFISPYSSLANPERRLKRLLSEGGFICKVCQCVDRTFIFSSMQYFKDFSMSTNVFLKHIPKNLRDEYQEDYMKIAETLGIKSTDEGKVPYVHQVMVAVARKWI